MAKGGGEGGRLWSNSILDDALEEVGDSLTGNHLDTRKTMGVQSRGSETYLNQLLNTHGAPKRKFKDDDKTKMVPPNIERARGRTEWRGRGRCRGGPRGRRSERDDVMLGQVAGGRIHKPSAEGSWASRLKTEKPKASDLPPPDNPKGPGGPVKKKPPSKQAPPSPSPPSSVLPISLQDLLDDDVFGGGASMDVDF